MTNTIPQSLRDELSALGYTGEHSLSDLWQACRAELARIFGEDAKGYCVEIRDMPKWQKEPRYVASVVSMHTGQGKLDWYAYGYEMESALAEVLIRLLEHQPQQ